MARPRKADPERRQHLVKVRLSDEELRYVSTAAELAGLALASFIRQAALGVKMRPRRSQEDDQLVRQLAALGNNLNQMARVANTSGKLPSRDDLLQVLDRVTRAIRRL